MPRKSLHSSINKLSYKSLLIILFFLLISIVVLWKFVLSNHKVSAAWWNDGWNYRKAISISNTSGSNLTDFQISVSIGTSALIASGKMQSDCDDIRVTDINGNLVPYWIDPDLSCNTTSDTIIYVNFSSIISGDNTAYLYYGNSSATSFQNGNDVFPQLFDTFDSTTINSSKFSYGGGTITQNNFVSMVNDADAWDTYFYDNSTYNRNSSMVFQSKFKADSGARVMVGLHDNGTGSHYNNLIYAFYFNNGSFSIYEDGTSRGSVGSYTVGNWYNIKIELKDTGAKYYYKAVNSTTWILLYDSSYSSESNLRLGVSHYDVTEYSHTDDWIIRKYASVEPSATLQSEEAGGGPIAYWKFDEGTGTTAYDSTSNQNNGSFLSAPVWKNESECVFGKCLAFDNVDDGVSINKNFVGLTDYTMSAWINLKGTHQHYTGTIMSSGNWNTSQWVFGINQANSAIDLYGAGNKAYAFKLNKWTQVTVTRSGSQYTFYVDGKSIGGYSGSSSPLASDASNTTIGRETYASGYFAFNGWIDEPKIYPYARTADQIKLDYNSRGSLKGTSANLGSAASDNNLSEGLVGYWKMDEGVGVTTADSSGNNNTGIFGAGSSTPVWSSGKYSVGTSFDGSDFINCGTSPQLNPTNELSVSLWFKSGDLSNEGLAGNWFNSTGYLVWGNNNKIAIALNSNYTYSTMNLNDNQWHHIVGTYKSGVVKLYVDGQYNNTTNQTLLSSAAPFLMGSYQIPSNPSYSYNGNLDEVRIYNRALSPTEVFQLYEYAPGPVGYWDLDEASGITAKDKSGNNNNGTLNSSSSWIQGKYGSAGNFNGTSDRVGILYSPILSPTESITFSAWAYKNNWTSAEASRIISKTEGGGYTLLFSNSIIYAYAYRNGAYATPNTSTSGLSPGWHYFTGSYDGRYTKIYIDGILKNTDDAGANYPLTYAYNNALFVGAEADSNNDQTPDINAFFTGKIDDVKIYNYTRTQKQIIEDMNANHPAVSSKSMIAYYNFDEGFGTNTYDFSPSKNNAVIAGTTLPTWQSSCAKGKCLSFPGGAYMSGYVQANSSIPLSNVFTISHWIKTSSSGYSISNSGGGNGYRLGTFGGKVQFLIGNSSNLTETSCGTKTVNDNKWHLIDGIYDNTNRKFTCYIDGKYESTVNTVDFTGFSTVAPMIGGYNYNGLIDEVKFYNYALTADEIKQDYNQGSALQMGQTSQTIGGTTTSLDYCIPGDTSYCASPIAEWKFDEKNGTVAYDTGSTANNGNLGPGGSAPTWIQGKIGSGLQFDGVDDRVGLGSTLSLGNTDWTVSAWIKTSSSGTNTLISNSSGGPVANLLGTINSKIVYYHYNSGWLTESGTSNIADGKWHYLTWANHSNQTIDLYVDGVGETLGASSTVMNTGPVNQIGRNWSTSSNASIDQVRIYNYARTPAQIAYDYNKGGPIGWWKFDECQGGTAYDWSGIGTTGVINIGPSGTQTSVGTCTDGLSTSAWNNGKTGKLNSSLNFDGTDDYVNLSNQSRLQMRTGAITVSQWIKLTGTTNYRSIFFGGGTGGGTGYGLAFNSGSTSIRYETMGSTGGRQVFIVNGGITLNNWYHVVAIFDGINNQMKLYVNGQEKHSASISDPGIVTNNSNFSIGSYNASQDWFFPGQIDDVRVFNYALTSEQIKTVYNNGSVNFN